MAEVGRAAPVPAAFFFFIFSPSQPAPSLRALAGRAWAERSAAQLYNYELAFAVSFTLLLIFGKENLIQLR